MKRADPVDADVIVIGTGMGGGTIGHALALRGKRVLFLEKGSSRFMNPHRIVGDFAENKLSKIPPTPKERAVVYDNAGRYHEQITDTARHVGGLVPFLGTGVGGSSGLYGGGLSRFFPWDFTPAKNFFAAGAEVPESWPIRYADLEPYYEQAEKLFGVMGDADPCFPTDTPPIHKPPPLSRSAADVFDYLVKKGIHPHRLPLAIDSSTRCVGCTGFYCPSDCKKDAGNVCVRPAVDNHGAILETHARVVGLREHKNKIVGVDVDVDGTRRSFSSPLVVLAAGGLETPRILLRSATPAWPDGLANKSGMVGRCLMRHYVDIYMLKPKVSPDWRGNPKEIAFNDFAVQQPPLGVVHSAGEPVNTGVVMADLKIMFHRWPGGGSVFRLVSPFLSKVIEREMKGRLFFFSIMEDMPRCENRVTLSAGGSEDLELTYRINHYDRERIQRFRKALMGLFRPYAPRLLKRAEKNDMLAHVCGTCRMGEDPRFSVVDRWNRCHDIENLYIVDASFFPTSSAVHPSLTIAANALRVADHIGGK